MLSHVHLVPERNGRTDRRIDLLYQYRASVCWRAIKSSDSLSIAAERECVYVYVCVGWSRKLMYDGVRASTVSQSLNHPARISRISSVIDCTSFIATRSLSVRPLRCRPTRHLAVVLALLFSVLVRPDMMCRRSMVCRFTLISSSSSIIVITVVVRVVAAQITNIRLITESV